MKSAIKELSEEQIQFVCKECSVDEETLFSMDDDELYDNVYDIMCDIECAETPTNGEKLTERCSLASEIVTILGNAISYEDDDEEETED